MASAAEIDSDDINDDIPVVLRPFCRCRAAALTESTKCYMARFLDPRRDLSPNTNRLQDWRGLAEVFEFSPLEIGSISTRPTPTAVVIEQWLMRCVNATVGDLLSALCEIERFDILNDDDFRISLG